MEENLFFLAQFEKNLQQDPESEKVFLLDDLGKIKQKTNYSNLHQNSKELSLFLKENNLEHQRVILLFPAGIEFVIAMISCFYAKTICVPLNTPNTNKFSRLDHVIDDCSPKGILMDINLLPLLKQSPNESIFEWENTTQMGQIIFIPIKPDSHIKTSVKAVLPEDVAFIQYTSGSTILPKGVAVTHNNIRYNLNYIRTSFQLTQNDVSLTWLPNYHDMGLIDGLLLPIYLGCTSYIMSPMSFLKNPLQWLRAISDYRVSHSGGPNFSYEMCVKRAQKDGAGNLNLSSWKSAYNGAEPILKETVDDFASCFKQNGFNRKSIYPCYGLAETTLMVTGCSIEREPIIKCVDGTLLKSGKVKTVEDLNNSSQFLVSSGVARSRTQVLIVEPESKRKLLPNEVGEVWAGGPTVASGYWNNEEETNNCFNCFTSNTQEGPFLRTGDMGFLDENGELFITGRIKDLIIINGENYYPQDIEHIAEKIVNSTKPHIAVAFSVENINTNTCKIFLVLQIKNKFESERHMDDLCKKTATQVYDAYGMILNCILLTSQAIPKTTSGKVQRQNCKKLYLEQGLQFFYRWENKMLNNKDSEKQKLRMQIENHLVFWIANNFNVALESIDKKADFSTFYLDSIKIAEMFSSIGKTFNIKAPIDLIYSYTSIDKLASYLSDEICDDPVTNTTPSDLPKDKGNLDNYFIPEFEIAKGN